MSNSENPSDQTPQVMDKAPTENMEIPLVKHQHDLSTPEVKSNDSIGSEAPSKDPEFEMLNPGDLDEGESVPLTKSGASSLGSFTEVESLPLSPGVEMTTEHSDMKKLLHEAGRESGESSNDTDEHTTILDIENDAEPHEYKETSFIETKTKTETEILTSKHAAGSQNDSHDNDGTAEKPKQNKSGSEESNKIERRKGEKRHSHELSDLSQVSDESNVTLFSSITYLGSSTVNAPVSDTELKRTMSVLKQQSRVTIDIVLSVGASFNGAVKLLDPFSKTVIATYQLQKILFCGRGDDDSNEADCFAFNICHGSQDIFHCHAFRCLENGAVS